MSRLVGERRKNTTWQSEEKENYQVIPFHLNVTETKLERFIDANPFVPDAKGKRDRRCDEILTIQAMGLKKRLEHT